MALTNVIVILTVIVMLVLMILEVAHPATIAFLTLLFFFILGLITPSEIMSSVSNEGVLTLALLFVIVSVIERTNLVERVLNYVLDKSKTENGALVRLTGPLVSFSMFFNNTPIVVMLVPAIQKWCKERGFYASKFLLPISYITIFGGIVTLIGTSTNLIVHGWLLERGFEGFSFFYLLPYSILGIVLGILYLFTFGYKILPENNTEIEEKYDTGKKFLYEAVIHEGCKLIGKTVTSNEIKQLKGIYLVKIERNGEVISPVKLTDKIQANDLIVFSGSLETLEALQSMNNISIKTGKDVSVESLQNNEANLVEGVISHNSPLVNQRIKDTNFRAKYDASIVAVHRKNERIEENIGDIVLKPGDVLLMLADKDFSVRAINKDDFYVITDIPKQKVFNQGQTYVAIGSFILMILLVAFGMLSMFEASLLFVGLYLILQFFNEEQVIKNMQFQVLILIVCSLGVGTVIGTAGTAELIANSIINVIGGAFGTLGLLAAVYLVTTVLTEVVTNAAAAIITMPIAVEVAAYVDVSPTVVAAIVAIAASASFATPIGYQTNLIVYGPGGYKFSDYLKVGIPLNMIFMVTVVLSAYVLL